MPWPPLTLADKFKQLSQRIVGTSDVPVLYTGSNYLPSDIAWWAITSYGGYDATASNTNVDIDYASFLGWASVFSGNNVYLNALFDGQKVTEVLRKIGRTTRSAIFIREDKIVFNRFESVDKNASAFDEDNTMVIDVEVDKSESVNRQYVFNQYSVDSDYFESTVVDASTPSINSYGLLEEVEEDKNIWYIDSASALDLAQRIISTKGDLYEQITAHVPLEGALRSVGETIELSCDFYPLNTSFRLLDQSVNMNTCKVELKGDATQLVDGFTLDVSTWDNAEDALV